MYYVCGRYENGWVPHRYDDDIDRVTSYQKIFLEDLERIEIGRTNFPSIFFGRRLVGPTFLASCLVGAIPEP